MNQLQAFDPTDSSHVMVENKWCLVTLSWRKVGLSGQIEAGLKGIIRGIVQHFAGRVDSTRGEKHSIFPLRKLNITILSFNSSCSDSQ